MRVVRPEEVAETRATGRSIRRIAILAADRSVLKPVRRALGVTHGNSAEEAFNSVTFKGVTVITGVIPVGLASAEAATEALFSSCGDSIDHLFVVTTNSAFDLQLGVGDVVFPTVVMDSRDGVARYPVNPAACCQGVIYSSDHCDFDDDYVASLNDNGVSGVDSVAGAVAVVCDRYDCAYTVVSAVSDTMDLLAEPRDRFLSAGLPTPASALRFALQRPQRIAYLIGITVGTRKAIAAATTAVMASIERLLQQARDREQAGDAGPAAVSSRRAFSSPRPARAE
ncbi:MAG: hypothetical protein KDI17_01735 [Halioglobus sp.]|nr:hypothetical protein [Halioglobus sp.]